MFCCDPQAREADGEPVVRKRTFDPFADPGAAPALLDALGPARAVLVCGLVTSICVNLTAAGFYQRGYATSVVREASADAAPRHAQTLDGYDNLMYRVVGVDDVAAGEPGPPPFV